MRENQLMKGEESAKVLELKCNLDDMTPEEIGFAMERLLDEGALDVWTESIGMKKSRPGVLLTVLAHEEDREKMLRLLFLHTTTLGVRECEMKRYSLARSFRTAEVMGETVHIKKGEGYGVSREKAEYDELAAIARKNGISIREALDTLREALKS